MLLREASGLRILVALVAGNPFMGPHNTTRPHTDWRRLLGSCDGEVGVHVEFPV